MGQRTDGWVHGWSILRHDGRWLRTGDLGGLEWADDDHFSVWRHERDAQRVCDRLNSGELEDPTAPERPGDYGAFYEVIPTKLESGKAVKA